ncbi:hypothetical protein Vi05172_g5646 [Venturia inaequalis]|nr:hypothetical protein Vi05172_g5646 [Venturia inaequalis]
MLPDYLSSSYARYKEDTHTVASWLANTAAKHGYSDFTSFSMPIEGPKPSGRLKGKARKGAKAVAANTIKPQERVISVKDFRKLSCYIASSSISVPQSVLRTLDRAIKVRRTHGSVYTNASQGCDQHTHFINVLEQVKETLQPQVAHEVAKPKQTTSSNLGSLSSVFEPLSLDVDADDRNSSPTSCDVPSTHDSGKLPHVRVALDTEQEIAESYFAVYCFFEDLRELLTSVAQVWIDYREGRLYIITASITVNTTIDLARNLEEELLKGVPKSCPEIVRMHYEACCQLSNKDPDLKQEPDDLFNFEAYEEADRSFSTILAILSTCPTQFRDYFSSDEYEAFKSTDSFSCKTNSNRDSYQLGKLLLIDCFRDLQDMMRAILPSDPAPIHDDFTRASIEWMYFSNRRPTLWMLFAAKVYLVSRHVLEGDVGRGCQDLHKAGLAMSWTIREHIQFHECRKISYWKETNMKSAIDMMTTIRSWATSAGEAKNKLYSGEKTIKIVAAIAKENHLANNPMMCGLLLYRFRVMLQNCGLGLVNASLSVVYAVHLYHAVKQEQLLHQDINYHETAEWADLEMIMTLQGDKTFFLGERPKTPEGYFKQSILSMGSSAVNYAKNRRNIRPVLSNKGQKKLLALTPVMDMFSERLLTETPRLNVGPDDVERILSKAKSVDHNGTTRKRDQCHTPVQLLDSLRTALQAEVLELTFDYLGLHRTCYTLFEDIAKDLKPDLMRTHREDYLTCPALPCLVGLVFEAAAKPKQFPGNGYLKRAADILSMMVRSESSSREYSSWKTNPCWGLTYKPTFQLPHGDERNVETWGGMFDMDQDTAG